MKDKTLAYSWIFWSISILTTLVSTSSLLSQDQGNEEGNGQSQRSTTSIAYPVPDTKNVIFDPDELSPSRKIVTVGTLTSLASNYEDVNPAARAMCLAIALRLDPLSKPAFMANFALKSSNDPKPYQRSTIDEDIAKILTVAKDIRTENSSDDLNALATHLYDIVLVLKPSDAELAYTVATFQERPGTPKNQWDQVFSKADISRFPLLRKLTGYQPDPQSASLTKTESAPEKAPIETIGSDSALARTQSLIKGLLVWQLDGNQVAGKATQMNATAVRIKSTREMKVTFNQKVGNSMESALGEVIKHLREKHQELPAGYEVELSFEEQYIAKDGPSAAVACALLLESLITGDELEKSFAVTGDMNADGSVQPVGGIDGKIRGAASRDCDVVAIPIQNAKIIGDIQMLDGPEALAEIQIFSIENFGEALALSKLHQNRDEDLKTAIDQFAEIQSVLTRQNGMRFLNNPHVVEKLRSVVKLAPNHLSARNLLLKALSKDQKKLSLSGSFMGIDRAAAPLIRALKASQFEPKDSVLDVDEYAVTITQLSQIRTKTDSRLLNCLDAVYTYATLMREFVNNQPKSYNNVTAAVREIQNAGRDVIREYQIVENLPGIQEEL